MDANDEEDIDEARLIFELENYYRQQEISDHDDSSEEGDLDNDKDLHETDELVTTMEEENICSENHEKSPSNFDCNLPGQHSYLGDDLTDVRGRTILEDETLQTLPLLRLPSVVLVPGQVLPLQLFHPHYVSLVRNLVSDEGDKTFGLLIPHSTDHDEEDGPDKPIYGTTAEILSFQDDHDDHGSQLITSVRLKAIGRQRFELVQMEQSTTGILIAQVRILPELILPSPVKALLPCGKHKSPPASPIPTFVFGLYDPVNLMRHVKRELSDWNLNLKLVPDQAVEFSFWVAANLPISDQLRQKLLTMNNAIQRLRFELSLLQHCSTFCCAHCSQQITQKSDVFCMAVEGPMGNYVNPGGHVHETLTVYKAKNLRLLGHSTIEHTWFPGYAWTIANCKRCHSHLGWKFTAAKSKRKLAPKKFYGLTRTALVPVFETGDWQKSREENGGGRGEGLYGFD